MSVTKKGWNQKVMFSLFKKEAAYDTAPTVNSTNYCSMKRFGFEPDWPDDVQNDMKEVTGSEASTDLEIISKRISFTYTEERAKPNSVIGFAALAHGSLTTTQDGAFTAYRHKIVQVTDGTSLASIAAEHLKGGVQKKYSGIKGDTFSLSGGEKGGVKLSTVLRGSGTRVTAADSFANMITGASEGSLLMERMKVWFENGASISIRATLTQAAQDISSGSGTALAPRLKSWTYNYDNKLQEQAVGGNGVLTDLHYGRRLADFKFSLLFNDNTEMDYFENMTALAIELDLKASDTVIAAGGALYPGFQLIIPRFKLKKAPLPKGGVDDTLTGDYECDIQNDGTNPLVILEGYNAVSAYLAA